MIREARLPRDEPAILSFLHGLRDHETAFGRERSGDPQWVVGHWRDIQHRCAERHGAMLVAEDDGVPVGWAFAHDDRNEPAGEAASPHGFLAELYVVPDARGKGHGRALMQACEAWARERGHTLLTVRVLARNGDAVRAYEAGGYRPFVITMRRDLS